MQMEQDEKRTVITIEVDADVKRWLEFKAAERMIEGRPHGERSVGAVVRELLTNAMTEEQVAA